MTYTGTVNPTSACLGMEIDNYWMTGVGTDLNQERVVLQLAWAGSTAPSGGSTDHIGIGILFGADDLSIMDTAMLFEGGGTYVNIIDTTRATITGNIFNFTNTTLDPAGDFITYGDVTIGATDPYALSVAGGTNLYGTVLASGLPSSAGGGGLYVCVDSTGVLYQKSSCP